MLQQEKEKMFLDLNSVLVKFWIEQGRPDKEIKIELLERMLNWYKKMGTITLDKQSKEPINENLEKEPSTGATEYVRKDTLLEWAKEHQEGERKGSYTWACYQIIIDKLNSM